MSAEIIQFVPRPNPNRMTAQELEDLAFAIMTSAIEPLPEPYQSPDKDSA